MKNFYVGTLSGGIRSQCKSAMDNSRLLFMVPGLTGSNTTLLLADCKDIATECSRQLVFRIADECLTAPVWTPAAVSALGGYFAGGNLTQYRNDETDGRLVVLVGVDLAADRGSLADFYRRGADALFAETMGGTFRPWVSEWLGTFGIEASKEWGKEWNRVLLSDEGLSSAAALERACDAPYGANIASAGLLLSVFFRAHANVKDIQPMNDGEAVEIDALATLFPDRVALSPAAKKQFLREIKSLMATI